MVGMLYRLGAAESRRRADDLLERFELTDATDRIVKTYSGGMRRRLDLAAALIDTPPVLFLDEPTTGLDPRSRLSMWSLIADLAKGGTTLLMTTQYLEEADQLADDIAVVDHGKVIARGTSLELKRLVGGERLVVEIGEEQSLERTAEVLASLGEEPARVDANRHRVSVPIVSHDGVLTRAVRALDAAGIKVDDVGFRRPTLDEVFLTLTGQPLESGEPNPEA
jgi:ABC-2 type transport system ATP-binding protein